MIPNWLVPIHTEVKYCDGYKLGYTYINNMACQYGMYYTYPYTGINVYYGKQSTSGLSDVIFWSIPWLEHRISKHTICNLDESYFKDITEITWSQHVADVKNYPEFTYTLSDDSEVIIYCSAYIEERQYKRGIGLFKWLSLFTKTLRYQYINIHYSEVIYFNGRYITSQRIEKPLDKTIQETLNNLYEVNVIKSEDDSDLTYEFIREDQL